tara:strand:- start:58 stop:270 length:213 start_codon:yes stop_codon:yes gene_type:complete
MPKNKDIDLLRLQDNLVLIHDELRECIKSHFGENMEQAIWKTRNRLADIIQNNFDVIPNNDYRNDRDLNV